MEYINCPINKIPVIYKCDLCIVGGSCTGVFAAVRAARLGLSCCLIERQNCFGGVATGGMVNIWHSLLDTDFNEQIIGGLTEEVSKKLIKRGAIVENNENVGLRFNSEYLKIELDNLVENNKIKAFLHTEYCSAYVQDDVINSLIVANKEGIGAIKARFFIDASGDGDVCRDLKIQRFQNQFLQPPSTVFLMQGGTQNADIAKLIIEHKDEFGLIDDWGWSGSIPLINNISMRADNHIFGVNCAKSEDLTKAEIEGRRQADALTSLLRKYHDKNCEIVALPSTVGIRDTYHYVSNFKANEMELLLGKRYDNAVMNGTYRIDVHHQHDNGITFKYLTGKTTTMYGKNEKTVEGNWRIEKGISGKPAKYYQIPFDILLQNKFSNFIAVGRMINADESSFGALRVMVNLNQLGEAAGVAAAVCVEQNISINNADGVKIRAILNNGGSCI